MQLSALFSFELRISKIPPPLLLAFLKVYLKLTSESSGPSRSYSSSISSFIQPLSFRCCSIFAIPVLSRAFQLLPWTSISVCHCIASIDECGLCCGVGGTSSSFWMSVVLSLAPLRNSYVLDSPPKQLNALWRKKRTAVQQVPNQNPRKHLHTSQPPPKKGNTSTQVTTSTTVKVTGSQDHSQTSHTDHSRITAPLRILPSTTNVKRPQTKQDWHTFF